MTKNADRNSRNGEKNTTLPKPRYQFPFQRRHYAVPFSPKWPLGMILLQNASNHSFPPTSYKNVFRHSPVVALRRKTLTLNLIFEIDIHLSDSLRSYLAGNKTVLFILKIHKATPIMLCFLFNFSSMRFSTDSTVTCQCQQFSTQINPTTTASNS